MLRYAFEVAFRDPIISGRIFRHSVRRRTVAATPRWLRPSDFGRQHRHPHRIHPSFWHVHGGDADRREGKLRFPHLHSPDYDRRNVLAPNHRLRRFQMSWTGRYRLQRSTVRAEISQELHRPFVHRAPARRETFKRRGTDAESPARHRLAHLDGMTS